MFNFKTLASSTSICVNIMHIYSRRMKTKSLDVFDFKEETDEFGLRFKGKLENPTNAIDKYTFLTTAAAGKNVLTEEVNYVPSLDIDAININHVSATLVEDSPAKIVADSNDTIIVAVNPLESSPELKPDLSESMVNVAATSASPSNEKFVSAIPDLSPSLPEHDEAVEMEPVENRSSSSCDAAEDDDIGPSSEQCTGGWESDSEDIERVIFYPEYVVYRDNHYTDPVISFTSSFIEMEGSTADDDDKTFKCKWGVEDILHITSHWHEQLEMVKIHVLTKDTIHAESVECTSVIGSSWYGRLEEITSLNVEYKALWSSMFEWEDTVLGQNGVSLPRYLPSFDQPFEEVLYPKGDADAVSISKRDFDLLQPETFVNDTIIDFYIKYLKNKIKPEEKDRFHFFNSFFFRKLADPDKDPLDASQGKVAYQRVKKWTRKVNLFEKDFVFIPVNYNYHWSVLVICHLGEMATFKDADADAKESIKVPCVLHMDSIRGSHIGLKGLLQSYLREEWIGRQQVASEDICSRFSNLRFISLELPQQQNSYDCGLFLLHYVELFLEQAPLHFNPFKITNSSSFLNVDWFPPAEASLKRVVIQRLISNLLENPYQESCSIAGNEQQCHPSYPTSVHKGSVVNFSTEDCNPSIPEQNSHEIGSFLTPSSSAQCVDDTTIASKSSVEPGSLCGTPFPDYNQSTTFDEYKGSLTPIQEDVEGGDPFVYSETEAGIQQDNAAIIPNDPYQSQDFGTQEPWQAPTNNHLESSSSPQEASTSVCEDPLKIVNEIIQLSSDFNLRNTSDQPVLETLSEYVQIVDVPENCLGLGSGSGSDVQHSTKKMRICE